MIITTTGDDDAGVDLPPGRGGGADDDDDRRRGGDYDLTLGDCGLWMGAENRGIRKKGLEPRPLGRWTGAGRPRPHRMEVELIDEFALAQAAPARLLAHPSGPRFDGKRWADAIGPAHADATARETVREVLLDASNRTNDLDDAARLKTAARLDAVLKIVRSFPALTIEASVEGV